jgi:hypothetical protein
MTEEPQSPFADTIRRASRRQKAYAAQRKAWAEAVGRPYAGDPDLRPPPGELDAEANEE